MSSAEETYQFATKIEWDEDKEPLNLDVLTVPEPLNTVGDAVTALRSMDLWLHAAEDLLDPGNGVHSPTVGLTVLLEAHSLLLLLLDAAFGEMPRRVEVCSNRDVHSLLGEAKRILSNEHDNKIAGSNIAAALVLLRSTSGQLQRAEAST